MSEPDDAAIHALTVNCLHKAIRRLAARTLEAPGSAGVSQFRQVERWMRTAIALAGAGRGIPTVQVHGLPSPTAPADPGAIPEVFTVTVTDLLAARASEHLPAALEGDADALRALDKVAEKILTTEDVQL